MLNPRHGGFSGKARRSRTRSRAARLYARQLISDYLESDPGLGDDQDTPVRLGRRNELLPSIPSTEQGLEMDVQPVGEALVAAGGQLQLPLSLQTGRSSPDERAAKPAVRRATTRLSRQTPSHTAIRFAPGSDGEDADPADATRKDAVGANVFVLHRAARSARPFTVGGFLYGCLLGSAAAAVFLLAVHLAVG